MFRSQSFSYDAGRMRIVLGLILSAFALAAHAQDINGDLNTNNVEAAMAIIELVGEFDPSAAASKPAKEEPAAEEPAAEEPAAEEEVDLDEEATVVMDTSAEGEGAEEEAVEEE